MSVVNPELELDELYKYEMQHELNQSVRSVLVERAYQVSRAYGNAVYSAANGRWDDVIKDVSRERITLMQAMAILFDFHRYKFINNAQYATFLRRLGVTSEAQEGEVTK